MDFIKNRRSIRKYSEKTVKKEDIIKLMEMAKYAPTGKNNQSFMFFGTNNEELIARLENILKKATDNDEYSLRGAKGLVFTFVPRDSDYKIQDSSCAMMNIYYGATIMGLGACWINQLTGNCDIEYVREFLDDMGVPKDYISYGFMALGHPNEKPQDIPRKAEIHFIQ